MADMPSGKWISLGDAQRLAIWLGGAAGLCDLNQALLPSLAPIPVRIVARDNRGGAKHVSPFLLMRQIAPNGDWRTSNRKALASTYLEVEEGALSKHISTKLRQRLKSSHARAPMLSQGQWSLIEALAWLSTHDEEMVNFLRPFAHSLAPMVQTNAFRVLCWTVAKREQIGLRFLWEGLPCINDAFETLSAGLTGGSIKATGYIQGGWQELPPSKFAGMQLSIQAPGFWPGLDTLVLTERSKIVAAFPAPASAGSEPREAGFIWRPNVDNRCETWLRNAFVADEAKILAKADFQAAALEACKPNLSVRAFLRVWNRLAPDAGRSGPGRKTGA